MYIKETSAFPCLIEALFIIANIWNQPQSPLTDEKENAVYTFNTTSFSLKMKEFLPFETTWMDLKEIVLSEINQAHRNTFCMISLTCRIKIVEHVEAENRMVAARGWKEGEIGDVHPQTQSFSYAKEIRSGDLQYRILLTVISNMTSVFKVLLRVDLIIRCSIASEEKKRIKRDTRELLEVMDKFMA